MSRPASACRLETRHLAKVFGSFTAVDDVSLSFEPGLIYAVLGENGAGKSTLMKLLFGLHQPTSGDILLNGVPVHFANAQEAIQNGIGMVQQHFSLVECLSVIDNIMLGAEVMACCGQLDRNAAIRRIEELLPSKNLALDWLTPVGQLTVGQRQRVEILKLLFRESQILFLDEPTAVLTPQEVEDFFQVLRELKGQGRTIVLVTHKINEVLQLCDRFSILRQGKLVASGDVSSTRAEQIVESMIGRQLPEFRFDLKPVQSEAAFRCSDLFSTPGTDDSRGSLKGLQLSVQRGEIVGVAGIEGSGQSHLIETIFGLRGFTGYMEVLGRKIQPGQNFGHNSDQTREVRNLGVGLIPEDRHEQALWLSESCHINMAIGLEDQFLNWHVFDFENLEETTASWARQFDLRASRLTIEASQLSGGNQQKLVYARELVGREPKFLICHQPTRGVDLGAIDLIHRKLVELRNLGLGILIMSSELDELLKLADRLVVLYNGRVAGEFVRSEFDRLRIGAAMTGAAE